jgi:endonuclease/exonuclease/phosphatase family metal-dependent hydrolase
MSSSLRVASWNVHCWYDGTVENIASFVSSRGVDVLFLQEATFSRSRHSKESLCTLDEIAAKTGLKYGVTGIFGGFLGNGILSRYPLAAKGWTVMTAEKYTPEPRSLVAGVVQVPRGSRPGKPSEASEVDEVVVSCIHVDHLLEDARIEQWRQASVAFGHGGSTLPHILGGDLNTLRRNDYPEALWEAIKTDRKGFLPPLSRLLPLMLGEANAVAPAKSSKLAKEEEAEIAAGGFGYVDSALASWSLAAVSPASDSVASAVKSAVKCVEHSVGVKSSKKLAQDRVASVVSAVRSRKSATEGSWDGVTSAGTTDARNTVKRRRWVAPETPSVLPTPLWSTCRFATRIDFVLVHPGAHKSAEAPSASETAASASASSSTVSSGDGDGAFRGTQPEPVSAEELFAALASRTRLCVPSVVPGSYCVHPTKYSDHDMVSVDISLC